MMNEEIMRQGGFGAEVDKIKAGFCPFCDEPISIDEFRDPLSRREYQISGVCQSCQDDFFGSGEGKERKGKKAAGKIKVMGNLPAHTYQRLDNAPDVEGVLSTHVVSWWGLREAIKNAELVHNVYVEIHGGGAAHSIYIEALGIRAGVLWWEDLIVVYRDTHPLNEETIQEYEQHIEESNRKLPGCFATKDERGIDVTYDWINKDVVVREKEEWIQTTLFDLEKVV